MQLGCGLGVKRIRGRWYLYFWSYEPRSWGTRRVWTYVGPVGRAETRRKAAGLLLECHVRASRELRNRIERLQRIHAAGL